ncbi:MAG: hypothetical protein U0821_09095 [Chloroflexota bacterium]
MDHAGLVERSGAAVRIVSLDGGATDILRALDLTPILPAPDPAAIADARPDIVFLPGPSHGETVAPTALRRELRARQTRAGVYVLNPMTLGEALWTIKTVGDAVGCSPAARRLLVETRSRIDRVALRAAQRPRWPRVALLTEGDPPSALSGWPSELIGVCGGVSIVGQPAARLGPGLLGLSVAEATDVVIVVATTPGRTRVLTPAPSGALARGARWFRAEGGALSSHGPGVALDADALVAVLEAHS